MNILIPMAGAGKRFSDAGYLLPKPFIPTTYRNDGKKYPMVVCAVKDIPRSESRENKIIFISRSEFEDNGYNKQLRQFFGDSEIINVDKITEGQACTCLLAKALINNTQPLMIGGCDNGMMYDIEKFEAMSRSSDVLVFTYRHNDCVLNNPAAYGWVQVDGSGRAVGVSVKKPISDDPLNDHAIVSAFWFRRGSDFVRCTGEMIAANDRINNEFYVDQSIKYCIESGLIVKVFEIDRYIGWGTPFDYENYERTLDYWHKFTLSKAFIPNDLENRS